MSMRQEMSVVNASIALATPVSLMTAKTAPTGHGTSAFHWLKNVNWYAPYVCVVYQE
jgi:hypothetical protein